MLGNTGAFNRSKVSLGIGTNLGTNLAVIAGEVLGYPRLVTLVSHKAMLFQPPTAIPGLVLGITKASVVLNASVDIITSGKFIYVGWGLIPNRVYYGIANGLLSSIPPATGLVQPVGLSLDANTLLIRPTVAIA